MYVYMIYDIWWRIYADWYLIIDIWLLIYDDCYDYWYTITNYHCYYCYYDDDNHDHVDDHDGSK